MTQQQVKSRQRVTDHGEVFTAEREVKAMCDLVREEAERIGSRFLEPACGTGNFLAEVLSRKLETVKGRYGDSPAAFARYALLALAGLYGVELLPDNAAECRSRLFALWDKASAANSRGLSGGRLQTAARQVLERNILCGNALTLQRSDGTPIRFSQWSLAEDGLLTRRDFALDSPMEFDVIISNPPYQRSDGGNGASARPLYHLFVEQGKALRPRFLSMIIPARWYSGGKGLDHFRASMLNDPRIRVLVDFTNSADCFSAVDVSGGVCYFLWARDYPGLCAYTNHYNGTSVTVQKALNEYPTFLRYPTAGGVISKVRALGEETMDRMVTARKPFGLATDVKPAEEGELVLRYNRGEGPYRRDAVTVGGEYIDKWKVMLSYLSSEHAGQPDKNGQFRVLSTMELLPPGHICTETYLLAGWFDTQEEAANLLAYLKTKFVRFLVGQIAVSQHITKNCFSFVPVQDFSRAWTDQELYAKYGLTEEETAFIEGMIKPYRAKPQRRS